MHRRVGCTRRVAVSIMQLWLCGCWAPENNGELTCYVGKPFDHDCKTGLSVTDELFDTLTDDNQEDEA